MLNPVSRNASRISRTSPGLSSTSRIRMAQIRPSLNCSVPLLPGWKHGSLKQCVGEFLKIPGSYELELQAHAGKLSQVLVQRVRGNFRTGQEEVTFCDAKWQ